MRINGTVVYYENNKGAGLVRKKNSREFYSLTPEEGVHPPALILHEGLEISFCPAVKNEEPVATKVRTMKEYKSGYVTRVNSEADQGYIMDKKGNVYWFEPSRAFLLGNKRLQPDDKVQFFASEGKTKYVPYAYGVACDKRSAIAKFSNNRYWDPHIASLAALAKEENWSYSNFDTEPLPLLKNYFMHTFEHVFDQDRIGYFMNPHNGMAYGCFHTGLISRRNEDIYAVFVKDTKKAGSTFAKHDWIFSRFTDSWVNLLLLCGRTPLPASYHCTRGFDSFDPSLEIRSVVDVILEHQKNALPKSFLLQGDGYCAVMVTKAIDYTLNLLKSGKIIPVAKYFYGSIEFVAPLWFEGKQSGMALVIKRSHDNYYFANNLIPLDIAYKNARLLGPVDSEWLKPVYWFGEIAVGEGCIAE